MKITRYIAIGLGFGFTITTFFLVFIYGLNEITSQLLGWYIASALYGISSMIFENKKLKPIVISIISYLCCLSITGVMIAIFYREYLLAVLTSFTVLYVLIYIIMFFIEKNSIKKTNEKLNKIAQNNK